MLQNKRRYFLLVLLVLVALSATLVGCSGEAGAENGGHAAMASLDGMPAEVRNAPVTVREAYQFAVANPETLQQFPCYCGCGQMGHTSNYSCYVQDVDAAGEIRYDTHALGCSICVDITQDVMRLQGEGKPIPEIQTYIDDTYSQYGPTNMDGAAGSSNSGS